MQTEKPESAGDETSARDEGKGGRLGGARADFVATLGRRAADARNVLAALTREPASRGPRDELRRKLHALGAGARLLRFEAMGSELAKAEALLDQAAEAGKATAEDLDRLARVLDDLPGLAWSDPDQRKPSDRPAAVEVTPFTALVVGEQEIATALAEVPDSREAARFACEHTTDTQLAFDRARAIVPDVIVLDGDLEGAPELTEALLDEMVTEPIPIVVLGRFTKTEEAARFVALGVARTLPKPVAAEHLHFTCEELVDQRTAKTMRIALGEPTVEQLGERLADEVRRALVDAVDEALRSSRIPLGQGSEVLGAVWGAIARVREVVTARTGGVVRFSGEGPEGAIAFAPWMAPETAGAERAQARGRGAAADVRLEGRRVVVADDDPAVTWFIADLLRSTGCVVHEALDGQSALDLCYQLSPDLVISDILMPKLDGFGLLRILKRDVALRDTPVILLSWKEDLLQRVRELGGNAAAYLRKESDARAIVARVREALWGRARLERRLVGDAEVRGRLDGVSVRTLLELACAARPNSRIVLNDASYHYEIEIRGGSPRRATRSGKSDKDFASGEAALASALGVGAARFAVSASEGAIQHDFSQSLREVLERPIARARASAQVLCGAQASKAERVELADAALDGYLRATPEPACGLVERIAKGASPRKMLLDGEVDPLLLDEVLSDLASRGLVTGVYGANAEDLLHGAFEEALALLKGGPRRGAQAASSPRSNRPAAVRPAPAATPLPPSTASRTPVPPSEAVAREIEANLTGHEGSASSLADAVMRELRERSSNPPPLVEPGSLRLRPSSSFPPEGRGEGVHAATEVDAVYELHRLTPSVEPLPAAKALPDVGDIDDDTIIGGEDPEENAALSASQRTKNDVASEEEAPRTPLTSVASKSEAPPAKKKSSAKKWLAATATLGLTVAVVGIMQQSPLSAEAPPAAAAAAPAAPEPTPEPATADPSLTSATIEPVATPAVDAGHLTPTLGDAGAPHLP